MALRSLYVYVYMCMCVYIYIYIHVYVYLSLSLYIHINIYIYIYIYICIYVLSIVCIICIVLYTHVYMYTYMRMACAVCHMSARSFTWVTFYLSNATCLIRPHLCYVCVCVRRVKDHYVLPYDSPRLKNTCVRQVVLDKRFPLTRCSILWCSRAPSLWRQWPEKKSSHPREKTCGRPKQH